MFHLGPLLAVAAGVVVLIRPRFLTHTVGIYLILAGLLSLNVIGR